MQPTPAFARFLPLALLLLALVPSVALGQSTGIIEVAANVDGALVFVDGEPLGETPLLEIIPAGRHEILVLRDGFADWSQQINLAPDSTVAIRADLQRLAAALEIRVDVADAVVTVDGEPELRLW